MFLLVFIDIGKKFKRNIFISFYIQKKKLWKRFLYAEKEIIKIFLLVFIYIKKNIKNVFISFYT